MEMPRKALIARVPRETKRLLESLVSDEATVAFDEVLLPFSPAVEPFVADMVEFETGEAEDADPADDICLHN
jgi:hypothetical protein